MATQYNPLCFSANDDGNYPSAEGIDYPGPDQLFIATGTFSGAAIKLQSLDDGHVEWRDVEFSSLYAPGAIKILVSRGSSIRAVISAAAAATDITATLTPYLGSGNQ